MPTLSIDTMKTIEKDISQITTLDFPRATSEDLKLVLEMLYIDYVPKIITVTGTNGKGSTVALLSYILQYNHIDHICHISPHIRFFNERISHNQQNINNRDLSNYLAKIYAIAVKLKLKLHYHCVSFLCTWLYIQDKKPSWAILEVGVGGRLDPANLFDADIAIITTVALDHCETLGHSIEQIAIEKAHIARKNKPVIIGDGIPDSAIDYLKKIGAEIVKAYDNKYLSSPWIHPNSMACALTAIARIPQPLDLPYDLAEFSVTGRLQTITHKPLIIADVAHNPQAVNHLFTQVKSLLNLTPKARVVALFIANQHKDIHSLLQCGQNLIDLWLIPDLSTIDPRFTPITGEQKQKIFPTNSLFFNTPIAAFDYVTQHAHHDDLIVAFGSFVLVGELSKYYDQRKI